MKIQVDDLSRILKICVHEAGHFIVARKLSFKTHGIKVAFHFPNGHTGESIIEPWTPGITNFKNIEISLVSRIKVLYAGVIAESTNKLGDYNSDYALNEWRTGGGMNDYAKIRELIHFLRNIRHPNTQDEETAQIELNLIESSLIQDSGNIVDENINLIYLIANTLTKKVILYNDTYTLSEEEIIDLLNQS